MDSVLMLYDKSYKTGEKAAHWKCSAHGSDGTALASLGQPLAGRAASYRGIALLGGR